MAITPDEIILAEKHSRDLRQQELVTKFSKEGDEYQNNLDQIDLWAMEIQELIKKIRGRI